MIPESEHLKDSGHVCKVRIPQRSPLRERMLRMATTILSDGDFFPVLPAFHAGKINRSPASASFAAYLERGWPEM